ncbi:MAG: porQ, partial [Flavisolibacter sp.]|nr:porQ [Flavisolibacter sp.]
MKYLALFCCLISNISFSQTLGGRSAYNFIKLPASPMLTAAGGMNTSYRQNEVSPAANNPALLHPALSTQINASFNAFLGAVRTYSLTGAYHSEKKNTTFGGHIYFVDYGSIPATDAAGNRAGDFRPRDFLLQVSAAKKYLEKWTYGGTLKFISSSYRQYSSSAIAVDFGVLFFDSVKNFSASLLIKNMGVQFTTYVGEKEDLPFDLQVGITKKLSKAPFGFSLTAQQLHRFDISYNDTTFNNDNGYSYPSSF